MGGGKRKGTAGRGRGRGAGGGAGKKGGGGGTSQKKAKLAGGQGGDHGGGWSGGTSDPQPRRPCPRNGIEWIARLASERAWEKADRAAILKTGGVDGLVGMMGTGSNCGGAAAWRMRVDSWIGEMKERPNDCSDTASSVVSLMKACDEADQKGIVADFNIMVRHIYLFLYLYR